MSAESAFASPVTRTVNGQEVTFERLKLVDHGQLEADVRRLRVDASRTAADECEVQGPERLRQLREAADKPVTDADVDFYVQTAGGARKAIELSLKRGGVKGKEADAILDELEKQESNLIAGLVTGYLVVRRLSPKQYIEGRDWESDSATLRKAYPGIDPSQLTIVQFLDLLFEVKAKSPSTPTPTA